VSKKPKPRKQPRRNQNYRPQLDKDLIELAEVIAEHKLENSAKGWFTIPWRDGFNAFRLAVDLSDGAGQNEIRNFISSVKDRNEARVPEVYWKAAELISLFGPDINRRSSIHYQYAALRCLQILNSNSDGGGAIYNTLLDLALSRHDVEDTGLDWDAIAKLVMRHRCNDALGMSDRHQSLMSREAGAFEIAWKRGLYHAAYSIRPLKPAIVTTMTWVIDRNTTIPTLNKTEGK